jgi:hypothetical protein
MRARRLVKIGHPASQQRELGVLEFRQIEREGDLSLEPGLYRVPIREEITSTGDELASVATCKSAISLKTWSLPARAPR